MKRMGGAKNHLWLNSVTAYAKYKMSSFNLKIQVFGTDTCLRHFYISAPREGIYNESSQSAGYLRIAVSTKPKSHLRQVATVARTRFFSCRGRRCPGRGHSQRGPGVGDADSEKRCRRGRTDGKQQQNHHR